MDQSITAISLRARAPAAVGTDWPDLSADSTD
jgi:hypothetical protein